MDAPQTDQDRPHCIVLVKGHEKFVFRYTPGSEAALISQLMDLAEDDDSPVSWTDVLLTIRRLGL
jgi:hypothetical protein